MANSLTQYYVSQAGNGQSYFSSPVRYQRGRGIGSFLMKLFRSAVPFFKSEAGKKIAKFAGKTALSTGSNVVQDVLSGVPAKQAAKQRILETTDEVLQKGLTRLQSGQGIYKVPRRKITTANKRKATKKRKSIVKRTVSAKKYSTASKRKKITKSHLALRKQLLSQL